MRKLAALITICAGDSRIIENKLFADLTVILRDTYIEASDASTRRVERQRGAVLPRRLPVEPTGD